jgi:hypothetical protein
MASSELSTIGLMLPALWIFSAVPAEPKHERYASTVAVIPSDLKVLTTDLRFEDEAPYLLWSVDSDGYLPYEEEAGLLADLIALCRPD